MKSIMRWLTYGFLAAVAAAVAAFPASEVETSTAVDPLAKAINDARTRFNTQSELLRREHSLAIAREVKASHRGADEAGYELIRPNDVPASVEAMVRYAADAMMRTLPRRDSTVRVVLRLVLDTGSTLAGAPVSRARSYSSTDIFIPTDSSDRVCAVIVRIQERAALYSRRMTLGAEPCYWFKAYGMPGRGMRAMIDNLRGSVIGDRGRRSYSYRSDSMFFRTLAIYDLRVMECMASLLPSCERLMTERSMVDQTTFSLLRTPGWIGYGRSYSWYFDMVPALLLTEFEREVGPARFQQLWTSDAPFPAAFADAKGVPLGEWVRGAMASRSAGRSGPLPPAHGWLVLLITISGFLALGTKGLTKRSAVV